MESEELLEMSDEESAAGGRSRRIIGVTTATMAALLALVTMMGHRLHTEEVVAQTKSADGWAFFQAKNSRSQMYAADAELAELTGPQGGSKAAEWRQKAAEEKRDADELRSENDRLDKETEAVARRATFFDAAEVCLEVAIVLCSIALLTGRSGYWKASFLPLAVGVALAVGGFVPRR
jgi:hypothetical protein